MSNELILFLATSLLVGGVLCLATSFLRALDARDGLLESQHSRDQDVAYSLVWGVIVGILVTLLKIALWAFFS